MANDAESKANAAFAAGQYSDAIRHFTDAITISPTNHLLYSKRSAAYASLYRYHSSLDDARKAIELNPISVTGYRRLGEAFISLGFYAEAVEVYERGLEILPGNRELRSDLDNALCWDALSGGESLSDDEYYVGALKWGMQRKMEANMEKEDGNAAYSKRDFENAIRHYSKAIELDGRDICFFTNRAAAYFEMGKYNECIKDCDKAVKRGRKFRCDVRMIAKALTRKGSALVKLAKCSNDFKPAIDIFHKALTEHRNEDTMKKLHEAETAMKKLEQEECDFDPKIADEEREKGGKGGNISVVTSSSPSQKTPPSLFDQTDLQNRMASDAESKANAAFMAGRYSDSIRHFTEAITLSPTSHQLYSNRSAAYASLRSYVLALDDARKAIDLNPLSANSFARLGVAYLGLGFNVEAVEAYEKGLEIEPGNEALNSGYADAASAALRTGNTMFDDEFDGGLFWGMMQKMAEAHKEKEEGNAAYQKKDFETAIRCYSRAMELDDEDICYVTNRAAAYLEMGKYDECIKDCDKAVERGRELHSDTKMIAKALTRKGTALVKLAKCSKDFTPAIVTFQKALLEHRNTDTLKKLKEAERAKKELEQQETSDPKIANEEQGKGNELVKEQKYPKSVKCHRKKSKGHKVNKRA